MKCRTLSEGLQYKDEASFSKSLLPRAPSTVGAVGSAEQRKSTKMVVKTPSDMGRVTGERGLLRAGWSRGSPRIVAACGH